MWTYRSLTTRERALVRFLWRYLQHHHLAPTLRELAAELGVSRGTVHTILMRLKNLGWISNRWGAAPHTHHRSLRLTCPMSHELGPGEFLPVNGGLVGVDNRIRIMYAGHMRLDELDITKVGNTIQMAGTVYQGEGRVWIVPFPGESMDEAQWQQAEVLTMDDAEWARFLQQTDTLEVEALVKNADGKIEKAMVRKGQRVIEQSVSWVVFKRDQYRCRYCGRDDVPLTVDHLVLWESGGPSLESNLLAACRKCNRTRGNTEYADWLVHPYYLKVQAGIEPAVREANVALVATLDAIPRRPHVRSR